jgi:hypothetical protein
MVREIRYLQVSPITRILCIIKDLTPFNGFHFTKIFVC